MYSLHHIPYVHKGHLPGIDGTHTRWSVTMAKQMGIVAPKTGKTTDTYFEKKFNYLSENDK